MQLADNLNFKGFNFFMHMLLLNGFHTQDQLSCISIKTKLDDNEIQLEFN